MADGNVLHVTRTKALSVVEIQKVLNSRLFHQLFSALCVHKIFEGISTKGWKLF